MRFKAPKLYNRVILAAFCLYFYPHLRYNENSVNLPSFLRYPFKKFCSSHNSLSVFLHLTYSFFYCEKTARKCLFFRGMTSGHHTPRNGLPSLSLGFSSFFHGFFTKSQSPTQDLKHLLCPFPTNAISSMSRIPQKGYIACCPYSQDWNSIDSLSAVTQ